MSKNFITLKEAQEYTQRYRDNLEKMITPEYKDALGFSETFDVEAIKKLIEQRDCVRFRAYYGMTEENRVCFIFTAVNAENEDILNGEESIIVDHGEACPPVCPIKLL